MRERHNLFLLNVRSKCCLWKTPTTEQQKEHKPKGISQFKLRRIYHYRCSKSRVSVTPGNTSLLLHQAIHCCLTFGCFSDNRWSHKTYTEYRFLKTLQMWKKWNTSKKCNQVILESNDWTQEYCWPDFIYPLRKSSTSFIFFSFFPLFLVKIT